MGQCYSTHVSALSPKPNRDKDQSKDDIVVTRIVDNRNTDNTLHKKVGKTNAIGVGSHNSRRTAKPPTPHWHRPMKKPTTNKWDSPAGPVWLQRHEPDRAPTPTPPKLPPSPPPTATSGRNSAAAEGIRPISQQTVYDTYYNPKRPPQVLSPTLSDVSNHLADDIQLGDAKVCRFCFECDCGRCVIFQEELVQMRAAREWWRQRYGNRLPSEGPSQSAHKYVQVTLKTEKVKLKKLKKKKKKRLKSPESDKSTLPDTNEALSDPEMAALKHSHELYQHMDMMDFPRNPASLRIPIPETGESSECVRMASVESICDDLEDLLTFPFDQDPFITTPTLPTDYHPQQPQRTSFQPFSPPLRSQFKEDLVLQDFSDEFDGM